ncbi:MAG: Flp/Fap pilin component [Solirubrobacteraceae bacterium]|nr:Flp/Fap pilin component [Solirubrobacteraceae bacterium]
MIAYPAAGASGMLAVVNVQKIASGQRHRGVDKAQGEVNCMLMYNLMAFLTTRFMELKEDESGQGLVEYALILVLISIVAIAAMAALGVKITNIFNQITTTL